MGNKLRACHFGYGMHDRVILVMCESSPHDQVHGQTIKISLHVITSAVRTAALAMTSLPMRRFVDSYGIYCARNAMVCKYAIQTYAQEPLDALRRTYRREMNTVWPLTKRIHPIVDMSAEKVYLMTALEFLPIESTAWIYDLLMGDRS